MAAEPILIVHNYYQQPGGEDEVFRGETALLEGHGHAVSTYTRRNDDLHRMRPLARAAVSIWNPQSYQEVRAQIRKVRPAVMHVHNTLPLVSPSVYYAAHAEGVPVVQTVHNYRLICPSATLYRDGHLCEDCVGKAVPWPGVVHACYRGSHGASAAVAALLTVHRALRTWTRLISVFIALTEAMKLKLVEGGVPADRLVVKPNLLPHDPGVGSRAGGYALFVGRLADVKGVHTLLECWHSLGGRIPLKIVGDGPLRNLVCDASRAHPEIVWLGHQPRTRVQELMRAAYALILPSVWYEPFSLVVLEAFAAGLPVIGSDLGSIANAVQHEQTGLHFRPGDAASLAAAVKWSWDNPDAMRIMARRARAEYEAKYTDEANYRSLVDIYSRARHLPRPTD